MKTPAAYFQSSVREFVDTRLSEILARLTLAHAESGFSAMHTDVIRTWWDDLGSLHDALSTILQTQALAATWQVVLEFTIPRKGSRIDVLLLTAERIVILECKTGLLEAAAFRQVQEYALLLHYFHAGSYRKRISPILVTRSPVGRAVLQRSLNEASQGELAFESLPSYWIARTHAVGWNELASLLIQLDLGSGESAKATQWTESPYRPTPTIVEAALALRTGLGIREIALSEAAEHDIQEVTDSIGVIIQAARKEHRHAICFLTGVPGSGKTLVGLGLAHLSEDRGNAIHFMSGNGPLVAVLQELFRRQAMRDGVPAPAASVHAKALIENVHVFARNYTDRDPDRPPSNHVVIFDEAQRAWNMAQNKSKFAREYSEPEMLLKLMARHDDWACVIALVGGGQEINSGEAGLEEWGNALADSKTNWTIYGSPEVLHGGPSTAGRRLFEPGKPSREVQTLDLLHLRTSNRSLRADKLAHWVNLLLEGRATQAAEMRMGDRFPLFLVRDLASLRKKLRDEALGESRFGLVASSGAARLRAEGLEPSSSFHAEYPWHHWYLASRDDVRSSFACEVFATEFEIQGLELDWVGLCWAGDFVWQQEGWCARDIRHGVNTRWGAIRSLHKQQYRRNAYRVLLTRARQGLVAYVPRGEDGDPTRDPAELDRTADFLVSCGVHPIP